MPETDLQQQQTPPEKTNTPDPAPNDWRAAIAGEDADALEALKGYETGADLIGALKSSQNADWRTALAGDDADAIKQLNRFKSGGDFFKSFQEAQNTIRSGQAKALPELGDEPTEEEIAAYREARGIPADPKGYLENLPDGMVFGEEDEAILGNFLEDAHGKNLPPEAVQSTLAWYKDYQQNLQDQIAEQDNTRRAEAVEALRAEWGTDYKSNIDSAKNFLASTFPVGEDGEGGPEMIMGARLPDGSMFGDNPMALKWLAQVAHEANPAGFVAPNTGLTQLQGVNEEIEQIETLMRTKPNEYYKDEAKQARLRQLYEAQERLSS